MTGLRFTDEPVNQFGIVRTQAQVSTFLSGLGRKKGFHQLDRSLINFRLVLVGQLRRLLICPFHQPDTAAVLDDTLHIGRGAIQVGLNSLPDAIAKRVKQAVINFKGSLNIGAGFDINFNCVTVFLRRLHNTSDVFVAKIAAKGQTHMRGFERDIGDQPFGLNAL